MNSHSEMVHLTSAEQTQLVMSEELCPMTFPFNNRMNAWLQELLPSAAEQPNLERFCGVRIPIPGWGGNFVLFRRAQDGEADEALMFPILGELGLSMYHGSQWAHSLIRVGFCDILKPCPMGQIWVWCAYCRKFLFPAEAHRGSRRHQNALESLEQHGPGYCTEWAQGFCRDRWL